MRKYKNAFNLKELLNRNEFHVLDSNTLSKEQHVQMPSQYDEDIYTGRKCVCQTLEIVYFQECTSNIYI